MNGHRRIAALEFRLGGGLLGIASLLVLADSVYVAWILHNAPRSDGSPPLDLDKYGLVGFLADGARIAGYALHALLVVGAALAVVVAVAAFALLLLSVLIYFTGRGISRRAGWARVTGVLLSLGFALVAIPALFAVDRSAIPVVAVPAVLSLYTLWVLILRYE